MDQHRTPPLGTPLLSPHGRTHARGLFPPLTLGVQRALCAISLRSPTKLTDAVDALYRSFWVDSNTAIGNPEGFMPVLEKVLGKEGADKVLKAVSSSSNIL